MASSDHLTRLKNIRDNLEKQVEDELTRVAALTAVGHPAPKTYSTGGTSMSWGEWYSTMLGQIKDLNDMIIAMGADTGGIPEATIHMW